MNWKMKDLLRKCMNKYRDIIIQIFTYEKTERLSNQPVFLYILYKLIPN